MLAENYVWDMHMQVMPLDSQAFSPFNCHSSVDITGCMTAQAVQPPAADELILANEECQSVSVRTIYLDEYIKEGMIVLIGQRVNENHLRHDTKQQH